MNMTALLSVAGFKKYFAGISLFYCTIQVLLFLEEFKQLANIYSYIERTGS